MADDETPAENSNENENNSGIQSQISTKEMSKSPPTIDTVIPEAVVEEAREKQKIDILLKPTGDAPIMKKKKWAVDPSKRVGSIIEFIRKYLKLESTDTLFLYVNQAFAPSPDQEIKNLFECFGSDGKLVLHYAKSQAWG